MFQRELDTYRFHLQSLKRRPLRNFGKISKIKRHIAALEEAGRDILNPAITGRNQTEGEVDRNNYRSYAKQLQGIYGMYQGTVDYGVELCRSIVATRAAFISGEGLSVYSSNKAAQAFIIDFFERNKLNGSKLDDLTVLGELEGKALLTLKRVEDYIKVGYISAFKSAYTVYDDGERVTYKDDRANIEKDYDMSRHVFARLGGDPTECNYTTNRIHVVLTEIENFSRAKFDLRKNTHVFGKYMPFWKTDSQRPGDAASINNDIASKNWTIGYGYAGPADFKIVEPSGAAGKAIIEDALLQLKCVSTSTGIPIHWFAWPELMSNRSTAETLVEMISAATKKERLVWEEKYKELIYKAMELAVDNGLATNRILTKDFVVKLPLVSYAALKQIAEVWIPLWQDEIVSKATLMALIPGINPSEELKQIEKEREEAAERSPMRNKTTDDTIDELQNNDEEEPDDGTGR